MLAAFMGLAVSACGDDGALEENNGNGNGGGNGGNDGNTPEVIEPSLDEESLKFVGSWTGKGPCSGMLVEGTWDFRNDGTYSWLGTTGYGTQYEESGTWHYVAGSKMLVTDSSLDYNWTVEDVSENQWVGTLLNS